MTRVPPGLSPDEPTAVASRGVPPDDTADSPHPRATPMPAASSLPARPAVNVWAAVRLLGFYCVITGMCIGILADAVEHDRSFPWLKAVTVLCAVGVVVIQGRFVRDAVGRA